MLERPNTPIVKMSEVTANSDWAQDQRCHSLVSKLHNLLWEAECAGVVITVDLEPLQPLAMRNYRMVGHVRGAR